jgi:pleiotropic regulator 1
LGVCALACSALSSTLLSAQVHDEYAAVAHLPPPSAAAAAPASDGAKVARQERESTISSLLGTLPARTSAGASSSASSLVLFQADASAVATVSGTKAKGAPFSASVIKRMAAHWPRPDWHAPWKLYRVISGHLGWVRSIAVDPGNAWFATGSGDRTIKIWDLASGQLKLTLTGHIEQVTGVAVSDRHPYMFSVGLDKMVKCWDLEYNKVIRHYHGHLSGIYSLALHPGLDVLMTGGRDSSCRVWDMRTKAQIFCLSGHDNTVGSILAQAADPQVITGSHDSTIKLWDLRTGKTRSTLTYHKKSVRAMAMHPREFTFASASADNLKKFQLPDGVFLHNTLQTQRSIINSLALNPDGVLVSGGDNGSLWFWDWKSGNCFQQQDTIVQPGSMESESAIFASAFDHTGSRLITCEADKTIKMWREDENATPETHPVVFKPPRDLRRY